MILSIQIDHTHINDIDYISPAGISTINRMLRKFIYKSRKYIFVVQKLF